MEKKRFNDIDFLRAMGIIGVIATHVFSYNLSDNLNSFIWNYSHFVVPIFVFASGYVLMNHYGDRFTSLRQTLFWYKKRLIRLFVPFYIYLSTHYFIWILFPNYFSGLGLSKSFRFIAESLFLAGGINLNWLIILFAEMTMLFPFLVFLFSRKKSLVFYLFFASILTFIFSLRTFPYSYYRYVMWIPWSLILIFSIYIFLKEQKDSKVFQSIKRYLFFGLISAFIFIIIFLLQSASHKSLNLIDYKYPPSLYYLSYAFAGTSLFLIISKTKIINLSLFKNIYKYISVNSYQLFFIHYVVLDFTVSYARRLSVLSSVWMQFAFVLLSSLLISSILNRLAKVYQNWFVVRKVI